MKKIKLFFLILLAFLILPKISFGQEENSEKQVADNCEIYFFYATGCPHCKKEDAFLKEIEEKYKEININRYEVTSDAEGAKLLTQFGRKLKADTSGVPFTVIGGEYISGFFNKETTGRKIKEDILKECNILIQLNETEQSGGIGGKSDDSIGNKEGTKGSESESEEIDWKMKFPILGEVDLSNYSLFAVTALLGGLDGFNPCAMWILLFLISILIGMKDKRRRWILGTVFILASGAVYFVFLSAWLNLLLFLGFIFWVRIVIGIFAIAGGGYNLKEYFNKKDGGCKVVKKEKREKIFSRIKKISKEKNLFLAIIGMILLAFSVNLIELVCSAGLPAFYTQILAINDLSTPVYYMYLLLYIFFFVLDDLLVFFIAMYTLKMTGVSTKYGRLSHLIGGILMIIIGLLLILKPEILMFS